MMSCWRWIIPLIFLSTSVFSAPKYPNWSEFLTGVREQAIAEGVRPQTITKAFRGLHAPNHRIKKYDRNQPEKRLTFLQYRNTRADAYRIRLGRKAYKKHQTLLEAIGKEYQVSPCFITSLWGLETSYGRYTGKFYVIQSLATLAYDSRRSTFFRKELLLALKILDENHITPQKFKGEWAGATGQPQFLPSSFHHYAVDHNGNGKKDIWNEKADVFASIANYLKKNGWAYQQPWGIPVTLPKNFDQKLISLKRVMSVAEWAKLGVHPMKAPFPAPNLAASIIRPYGGPTLMVFNNFKVLMRWNRSTYYAGTVAYLANKICSTHFQLNRKRIKK